MEPLRPSPPITVEGGPGWAVGDPDVLLAGDDEERPPRGPGRRRAVGLATAVVLGFAAGTVVADLRSTELAETDAGALSLVALAEDVPFSGLASTADGRPAIALPIALRNTGPRVVALEEVDMPGTGLAAEDLDGERLAPGGRTVVQLLRPLDCDDATPAPPPGPLRVRATTDAGERVVQLRATGHALAVAEDIARASCGRVPPGQAVHVRESAPVVESGTLRLAFDVGNASREPLQLLDVRAASGLDVLALLDGDGAPLSLPLTLPAGDFSAPREPWGMTVSHRVVALVEPPACSTLADLMGPDHFPLLELEVGDAQGRPAATTSFGDPSAFGRLRASVCPGGL